MPTKLTIRLFVISAGVLLLITATAKLVSGFGNSRVLQIPDPILALPFRYVFLGVGLFELLVASICFFSKRVVLQNGLIALLAINFVAYRLGLLWGGYHRPCGCLGNLTDALHISPQAADNAMKVALGYLLIGSCATLLWLRKHNAFSIPLRVEATTPS